MKKYIALALCLCAAFTLCACRAQPQPTTVPTTTPQPSTVPATEPTVPETTAPTLEIPHLPLTAVAACPIVETETQDIWFEYTYPDITLQHTDPEITEKVTLELLNRIDQTRTAAENIRSEATEDELNFYTVAYNPGRVDNGVLSLYGTCTSYAGGMHPSFQCVSVTYDLLTGDVLSLTDVLTAGTTAANISPLVVEALAEVALDTYLYSDYTSVVEERFALDLGTDGGWYLSNQGLCFYFSPYEVAPYSSGIITACIPYESLSGILRDEFFPIEKSAATGTVEASLFSNTDPEQFDQFAEIILEKDGESVLLHTEGLVYDVFIEYGTWNMDGTIFSPTSTVFAASSLTPYDGILLQTYFPDVMPNLRLSYTTDSGIVQKYIFQSGKDGSILLLDE